MVHKMGQWVEEMQAFSRFKTLDPRVIPRASEFLLMEGYNASAVLLRYKMVIIEEQAYLHRGRICQDAKAHRTLSTTHRLLPTEYVL